MSRLALLRKLRDKISPGFRFGRPLVLLQSDDWGRVGVRDSEGLDELRAAGLNLGERPYDFYSLETAEDVHELAGVLAGQRDGTGQPACIEMNFVVGNVDCAASAAGGFREAVLSSRSSVLSFPKVISLAEGLPGGWVRSGLNNAYRQGIAAGVFSPALHGTTHFCRQAVVRALTRDDERGELIRTLWNAGTPYIHWRMPWVGYEYWDPEMPPAERFLPEGEQEQWIGWACQLYRQFFKEDAVSACAPGYRADASTHRLWKAEGIRVAQNGPGPARAPHFDEHGLLHTYRSLDFEPALNPELRWEDCEREGAAWLDHGIPLIVSIHSINFHSTLAPFRQRTLPVLRDFLSGLSGRYPDLLYVNTRQLLEIIETGSYRGASGRIEVTVSGKGKGVRA